MSKQVFFIPHGGGPLPLLGEENHTEITELLKSLNATLDASSAILLITAHWESEVVTFSGSASPDLIFDYHGFPPETYHYQYPVPGAPDLAEKAHSLLTQGGLPCAIDPVRGFDHGTFVPMMLMRPEADIPILQMSVVASFDPITHITAGQLLAPLLDEGVTIIGSGMTFHNMDALSVAQHKSDKLDCAFDDWLNESLSSQDLTQKERIARLAHWSTATGARFCQPREDHFVPLLVASGAGIQASLQCENMFREEMMGFKHSGFRWTE